MFNYCYNIKANFILTERNIYEQYGDSMDAIASMRGYMNSCKLYYFILLELFTFITGIEITNQFSVPVTCTKIYWDKGL